MLQFANGYTWHDLYYMPTKLREFYWRELLLSREPTTNTNKSTNQSSKIRRR